MTKEDIYDHVCQVLMQTFCIPADQLAWDAKLYEELDIDSIDAVDLIVKLKPLVGKRLDANAFKSVRTLGDVVDAIHQMMLANETAVS